MKRKEKVFIFMGSYDFSNGIVCGMRDREWERAEESDY